MQPSLLLDTHIVVRWMTRASQLSREQSRAIDASLLRQEPLGVSAITLMEIAVLSEGRLRLKRPIAELLSDLRSPVFEVLPLTLDIASEIAALASLRDPADRAFVATARVHRLRLVTSDQRIIESKLVNVID